MQNAIATRLRTLSTLTLVSAPVMNTHRLEVAHQMADEPSKTQRLLSAVEPSQQRW